MAKGKALSDRAEQQLNEALRRLRDLEAERDRRATRHHATPTVGPTGIGFRNNSGETIPAFAVMKITGATTLGTAVIFTVEKPGTEFARFYLVNGSSTVSTNDLYGSGSFADIPDRVLYDSADGTPAYGQVWGPYPSSWKLRRHMYGFRILGDANTTDTHVRCDQHWVMSVVGKTNGAYSKGATNAALSVWKGDASADSTADITSAHIPYAAAGTGKWGEVVWHSETPRFTALEC